MEQTLHKLSIPGTEQLATTMARGSADDREFDRRVTLQGANNYGQWKTDCEIELDLKGLSYLLDPHEEPTDPNPSTLRSTRDEAQLISDWLANDEELPEEGFTAQKISGNRRKWLKDIRAEWDRYQEDMKKAFSVIYRSCAIHIQGALSNTRDPRKAWEILQQSYGGAGFGGIFRDFDVLAGITYDSFNSIEAYSNTFKAAVASLERQDLVIDTRGLAALYLRGLGTKFH